MTDRMREIELRALHDLRQILDAPPPPPPGEPPRLAGMRAQRDRRFLADLTTRKTNQKEALDAP